MHKARHKETNELVALKRILMHNEKEGVKYFTHLNSALTYILDTYYSYERNKDFKATSQYECCPFN